MELSGKKISLIVLAFFSLAMVFSFFLNFTYKNDFLANILGPLTLHGPPTKLENPPDIIKSVYMTGWSAGSKNYRKYLSELFKTTQVNAVVIDIKDVSGIISYRTGASLAKKYGAYWPQIANIDSLVHEFHNQGIYVIGRIAVFQDDQLAKNRPDLAIYNKLKTQDLSQPVLWGNNNGLHWVDPASEEVWDYNIEIARDALSHGFDEINFDYVRFPTDGNLKNMGFPKWDAKTPKNLVIKNFSKKMRESLPDEKISVDLFGLTAVNYDDLGIGQIIEDFLEYFDYVCPMIYPSHFANGFLGLKNPAEYPYEVVKYSMIKALLKKEYYKNLVRQDVVVTQSAAPAGLPERSSQSGAAPKSPKKLAKIRPWIQDFNLGAVYDAKMVSQQIQAVTESTGEDFSGFMLWSPSNIYTDSAVLK